MQSIKRTETDLCDTTCPIKRKNKAVLVRYFKGVGKFDAPWVIVQRNYISEIVPFKEFAEAQGMLQKTYPLFEYECIAYNLRTKEIKFEACPHFDFRAEPMITECAVYNPKRKKMKIEKLNTPLEHKWMTVKDDYTGFDVQKSYEHSKIQEEI